MDYPLLLSLMKRTLNIVSVFMALMIVSGLFPLVAFASDSTHKSASYEIAVSDTGNEAFIEGATFAISDFSRFEKGSNQERGGEYIGYNYYLGSTSDYFVAVVFESDVVVYMPASAHALCDVDDPTSKEELKAYICSLDDANNKGGSKASDKEDWVFTSDQEYIINGEWITFAYEAEPGKFYLAIRGTEGQDITQIDRLNIPSHVDIGKIVAPGSVDIVMPKTGLAALGEFLAGVDYSPLWVTLKTTGCAIVIIFVLGLAAAYFTMRISKRAQDIFDTIFTIPMVLPPTVCGFLLLLLLGRNTALGQWFIDIGFPLIFSWPATVIAASVVAFPLMYRSCRGAFENLDPNMMDAARTLGWSNAKIFFKLMIPLSWSSIAAATVLAFARALGEFGATLFLAGNYVGITRTIPIAIYFEWMSGNTDVAIFWTIIILIFSFFVILFINLWSRRTTKYRLKDADRCR